MTDSATPTNPTDGTDAQTPVDSPVNSCPANCPRCRAEITAAQVRELYTSASDERVNGTVTAFNYAYLKFEITTCLRKAHFFAQSMEEVGMSINLSESMNYRATALGGIFSYFRRNPAEAQQYGRTADHAADQEAIANRAYANRNGNGDIASGDGWRFRGGGYIQLTGRGLYTSVQAEIDQKDPGSGIDIVNNEGDIRTYKGAMLSAMGYWTMNRLNVKADMGDTDEHVNNITAVVNRATDSYPQRREHFHVSKVTFKVAECVERAKQMLLVPLGQEGTAQPARQTAPETVPRPVPRPPPVRPVARPAR